MALSFMSHLYIPRSGRNDISKIFSGRFPLYSGEESLFSLDSTAGACGALGCNTISPSLLFTEKKRRIYRQVDNNRLEGV